MRHVRAGVQRVSLEASSILLPICGIPCHASSVVQRVVVVTVIGLVIRIHATVGDRAVPVHHAMAPMPLGQHPRHHAHQRREHRRHRQDAEGHEVHEQVLVCGAARMRLPVR